MTTKKDLEKMLSLVKRENMELSKKLYDAGTIVAKIDQLWTFKISTNNAEMDHLILQLKVCLSQENNPWHDIKEATLPDLKKAMDECVNQKEFKPQTGIEREVKDLVDALKKEKGTT